MSSCYLPPEIIQEILKRVHVNCLQRFRSVSKSWRALIDSDYFVRNHLDFSNTRLNIISHCHKYKDTIMHCSVFDLLSRRVISEDYMEFRGEDEPIFNIVGSCNGIMCIEYYRFKFYLFNSSTGCHKKLPKLWSRELDFSWVGFGYDKSNLDYKVVLIDNHTSNVIVQVCSSKRDSWTKIVLPKYHGEIFGLVGTYWSGKLCWIGGVKGSENSDPSSIVFFDLSKETFESIELPENFMRCTWSRIGVVDGIVCVLSYDISRKQIIPWVLKQDEEKLYWKALLRIAYNYYDWEFTQQELLCDVVPLHVWMNGDFLYLWCSRIMIYESAYKASRKIMVFDFKDRLVRLT